MCRFTPVILHGIVSSEQRACTSCVPRVSKSPHFTGSGRRGVTGQRIPGRRIPNDQACVRTRPTSAQPAPGEPAHHFVVMMLVPFLRCRDDVCEILIFRHDNSCTILVFRRCNACTILMLRRGNAYTILVLCRGNACHILASRPFVSTPPAPAVPEPATVSTASVGCRVGGVGCRVENLESRFQGLDSKVYGLRSTF